MAVTIAVAREAAADEPRVALTPSVVSALTRSGASVVIEAGAGERADYADQDYADAGATLATSPASLKKAHILACVGRPSAAVLGGIGAGCVVVGLLDAWDDPQQLADAATRGVHLIDLAQLPRQISRAQAMDVLSSQASIAGYRSVIVAAEAYGRYFPMMVTAAGTAKPARVLVLGAGVAGLQAIATARRLGARVTGYDVRPAAREEVASLGAQFLSTTVADAVGAGGYARELSAEEAAQQQRELSEAIATFDIVITTAKVPGRTPPVLVSAPTLAAMRRGSVLVDLAAGPLGGNVAGVKPRERMVTPNGATVMGAGALAADMAPAASDAFAKNIQAVLSSIVKDGELAVDPHDDVIGAMLIKGAHAAQEANA